MFLRSNCRVSTINSQCQGYRLEAEARVGVVDTVKHMDAVAARREERFFHEELPDAMEHSDTVSVRSRGPLRVRGR